MNPLIAERFEAVEVRLLQSPAVSAYEIIRQEIGPTDGKLRVKVTFTDSSLTEFFEYVIATGEYLKPTKYSFHWQEASGKLNYRWDNAPHHPDLPYAPHHCHNADQSVNGVAQILDIFGVLDEIETFLQRD
jgi:hypothetical protein